MLTTSASGARLNLLSIENGHTSLIATNAHKRHLIDFGDLTRAEWDSLYQRCSEIMDHPADFMDACRGRVMASLFYEPSNWLPVNGPEMIKRGEIDEATIGSDILDSWLADDTTKDMVSMDRPNTNYTYFYMFNFMPFAHEFSNWNVEGVDAEYEPENWAKAINNTNFRKAFLYGIIL